MLKDRFTGPTGNPITVEYEKKKKPELKKLCNKPSIKNMSYALKDLVARARDWRADVKIINNLMINTPCSENDLVEDSGSGDVIKLTDELERLEDLEDRKAWL